MRLRLACLKEERELRERKRKKREEEGVEEEGKEPLNDWVSSAYGLPMGCFQVEKSQPSIPNLAFPPY